MGISQKLMNKKMQTCSPLKILPRKTREEHQCGEHHHSDLHVERSTTGEQSAHTLLIPSVDGDVQWSLRFVIDDVDVGTEPGQTLNRRFFVAVKQRDRDVRRKEDTQEMRIKRKNERKRG